MEMKGGSESHPQEAVKVLRRLNEVIRALEIALDNATLQYEDERFYEPLRAAGLGEYDEEDGILEDRYYDAQCVWFALKVLRLIRGDV